MTQPKKRKTTPKKVPLWERIPRVNEALLLLKAAGIDIDKMTPRRRERLALALLTSADLRPDTPWSDAKVWCDTVTWKPTTREFIAYWNTNYSQTLADSSYDDVLREDLIWLLAAKIVVPSKPESSRHDSTRGYCVSPEATKLIRLYGTAEWKEEAERFCDTHGKLSEKLMKRRPIKTPTIVHPLEFVPEYSYGEHGELLRAVIEQFLPRFLKRYKVIFFEDNVFKYAPAAALAEYHLVHVGVSLAPDILVVDLERNLLYIFECVHTANPISDIRHHYLNEITAGCKPALRRVFVSVFRNRASLAKYLKEISWETEVWLIDDPEHVIHFDGENEVTSYDAPEAESAAGEPGGAA